MARDLLTPSAKAALDGFLAPAGQSKIIRSDGVSGLDVVKGAIPLLLSVASQIEFLITDREVTTRRLTERAFMHLQRQIVVDDTVANKWKNAYAQGETACERIGSVHLFGFGIYAFKADASGARTDLILSEPLDAANPVLTASEALVLTEWKKVSDAADAIDKERSARAQAQIYQGGALAGFELQNYRYIVLVSRRTIPPIADVIENGVNYRHILIVVEPEVPSKAAQLAVAAANK